MRSETTHQIKFPENNVIGCFVMCPKSLGNKVWSFKVTAKLINAMLEFGAPEIEIANIVVAARGFAFVDRCARYHSTDQSFNM